MYKGHLASLEFRFFNGFWLACVAALKGRGRGEEGRPGEWGKEERNGRGAGKEGIRSGPGYFWYKKSVCIIASCAVLV